MKNNTFKRVLAGSLALLTVAAYVPANVGGILPDLSIVASAAYDATHPELAYNYINGATHSAYIQENGLLRLKTESVAFVEGLYEITVDAGKYVYTKVEGTDVYTLKENKAYVLRTKAFMDDNGTNLITKDPNNKDLNEDDLPAGVYEYTIKTVGAAATLNVETKTNTVKVNPQDFAEGITVTQNGNEIKYDANANPAGYIVAQGFPVEVTAVPGEVHTNQMLKVDEATVAVKGQTKSGNSVTLTFVAGDGAATTTLSWADYQPTLLLTNDNGTIRATDVGFNALISNAVVGTYEFKYGYGNNPFVAAETNAKGQYVYDARNQAYATFNSKNVTIGNKTYNFFEGINPVTTVEKKNEDTGIWSATGADGTGANSTYILADTKNVGTWRVTTEIPAAVSATLSDAPFKIATEFTVAGDAVTGTKNLVFVAPTADGQSIQRIDPANGVYCVPWQNGDEIEPNLVLFKDAAKAQAINNTNVEADAVNKENNAAYNADFFHEGSAADYTVTGTTKASEEGTYTLTITPTDKSKFNDGEEITITWQIVNTNNYVKAKKTPTGLSDKNATTSSDTDAEESAKANAQHFNIGYRQANSKTILEKITKSLDFVGSQDLTVVEYRKVDWTTSSTAGAKATATLPTDGTGHVTYGVTVEDPSEKAGTYVALVANALKNDGKTSAMMKDNTVYNDGALYPVYFQVTKTRVRIVPDITEITYGDDVELSKLYKVIDADTKETIKVPWKVAPKFVLKDKYSEKILKDAADNTETLDAGEYVYGIAEGDGISPAVLDSDNYNVKELIAEDQTDFTVKPRNLQEMDFGTVNVPVAAGDKNVAITKARLAYAANLIEANPVDFTFAKDAGEYVDVNGTKLGTVVNENVLKNAALTAFNFNISGGTTSAKVTDLGKMLTVTIKGVGNFEGTKTITWVVGDSVLSDEVLTYEAEFDAAKPRVMAKFNTKKVDGEIEECGFYYCNNGKMNEVLLDGLVNADGTAAAAGAVAGVNGVITAQEYAQYLFKQVDKTGENMNQKGAKKVTFTNKAVTTALSGNGFLTAEIANSSVLKQVYIMPYVKYKNGNVAYGEVDKFNYYDMVLNAEGALEMTKTDFVGDGKIGTEGKTYVKVDVTRVDKKGYEVERYGILYNNSDSWTGANKVAVEAANADQGAGNLAKTSPQELAEAYQWLNIDYESEKTVKVAEIPEKDLATKIGTNTYIANTTAKKFDNKGNVSKDYGYGAKTVFARAFIQIKDAAGNSKVYYSHLADVTYGGFTVDTVTGVVNGTESGKAVTDSKNTSQILFFAPTNAKLTLTSAANDVTQFTYGSANYEAEKDGVKILDAEEAFYNANETGAAQTNMTRMNASTGDKTFQVWWADQKKS